MKIAYGMCSHNRDFTDTLENVTNAAPFFDCIIVVEDGSKYHRFTADQRRRLTRFKNVVLKTARWEDSLPKMYQHMVAAAHQKKVDWLAFSDPDEHFNDAFLADARMLCERYEKEGYDMLGVNCRAQFAIKDKVWPSSLSVDAHLEADLESYPKEVVKTNDHKYMLMRRYDDLQWGANGRLPTVHTTWFSPTHPWKATDIPDSYWYLHRKTPLQVYASAARNMFMCGGGANLGDINTMWVELKAIMRGKGIRTWPQLERYVMRGSFYPLRLVDWIKRALTWKATDYGTETRQTALWLIYYNKELLNFDSIEYGVNHPPQLTEEDRVERFVQECYVKVLGRWPDGDGLANYKKEIMTGQIQRWELELVLKNSQEYLEKFGEKVHLQVPVEAQVKVNDAMIIGALFRSNLYLREYKPLFDVGRLLLSNIKDRESFLRWFYANRNSVSISEFVAKVKECA